MKKILHSFQTLFTHFFLKTNCWTCQSLPGFHFYPSSRLGHIAIYRQAWYVVPFMYNVQSIFGSSLSPSKSFKCQTLRTCTEMLHALGFSVSLYAYFRDPQGNPLTERNSNGRPTKLHKSLATHLWSDRVIANFSRSNWSVRGGRITKHVSMVVTPRVVVSKAWLRKKKLDENVVHLCLN